MKFLFDGQAAIQVYLTSKDHPCDSFIEKYYSNQVFKGDIGEIYPCLDLENPKIYLGLGDLNEASYNQLRDSFAKLSHFANQHKIESLSLDLLNVDGLCSRRTVHAYVEGLRAGEYKFDRYLSEKHTTSLKEIYLKVPENKKMTVVEDAIDEANTLVDKVFVTRDLVNTPAMDMYPKIIAQTAKDLLEKDGVQVSILGKKEIEDLGMTAFLSVARGSAKEPQLLIMNYQGDPSSKKTIAYVGKGLAYDSGGYCIKTPGGMKTMQSDMGGSATVIGAISAIAKRKLKVNVVGVCALCENMISGDAYKTGDIIGSLRGLSIEVGNTDAEGRITLADALTYAVDTYHPEFVVDLATLTGACIVALGDLAAGAVTNCPDTMALVKRASEIADEQVWELPNLPGYQEYIKSDVADVYNTGKIKGAGTITAGLFLEKFVDQTPWVHLDIAGTAWLDRPVGALPKGATGSHVKTLYHLAKRFSKAKEDDE